MHTNTITIIGSVILSFIIAFTSYCMTSNSVHAIQLTNFDTEIIDEPASFDKLNVAQKKEVECLAKNIYYEAAGESEIGWMAVASVTMNRLITGNYADTVCGVVYQKTGRVYQFSWVGMKNKMSKINSEVYNEIVKLATSMYLDYDSSKDVTKGSTFYHADYINPSWPYQRVKQIGTHIFYRAKVDYKELTK